MPDSARPLRSLVTGASGFVGGNLLIHLAGEGAAVRAMVRNPDGFESPEGDVEVVVADLDDPSTLPDALKAIDTVFYLVHSMDGEGDLADQDREAAQNMAAALERSRVRRVVYLGAVGYDEDASAHLQSRHEVEEILAHAGPSFVAVRASMVVGAGSDSFATLAKLVDRLPVLALPSWSQGESDPIGIDDVVRCLAAAAQVPGGRYDVGGPDTMTFEELMEIVAELLGVKRPTVKVPVSNATVEGLGASLVTGEDRSLVTALVEGLHDDLHVEENDAEPVFGVTPMPFREAARLALAEMDLG